MKRVHHLPVFLLSAAFLTTGTATAQWFSPWGSENDLATAWGLEPNTLDDPNEGPGETIDYSSPEQPFGMNVQSGSQMKPLKAAPVPPTRPLPAAPAAPIAKARPTAPPPVPARPARPAPPRQYYQRRAPAPRRDYGRYRQPLPPMPYYAPKPLPPLRMPVPMSSYPYYRR